MGRNVAGEATDRLDALWAKTPRGGQGDAGYHPLLAHVIDVAQVTRLLWREVLPPAACRAIAQELALPVESAGQWVAFWAGLHDLGKASPAFAHQNVAAWERIRQAGFTCPRAPTAPKDAPHGTITAFALPTILVERLGLPPVLAEQVGQIVGGHHGVFPGSETIEDVGQKRNAIGDRSWSNARDTLVPWLSDLLALPVAVPANVQLSHQASMYLAGLVSVADWIGSNAEIFKFHVADPDARAPIRWPDYVALSERRAGKALDRLGWLGWPKPVGRPTISDLFPAIAQARTLQVEVARLADELRGPCLVAIEAPMGEGKTEAALLLADRWGAADELGCGLYVTLPTQATSNQMFGRVKEYLAHRHPGKIVNLQLLHGHAELSSQLQVLRDNADALFAPTSICDDDRDAHAQDATVIAAEWFTSRKRGLLAPFGVGTVDQLLLAVLKTRHGFVRLFGLGHKTIIVDEVHAYDTYMTTILERLLHWLAALGASVVLLSATLPRARLERLLASYAAGRSLPDDAPRQLPNVPYPRISWVDGRGVDARPVAASGRSTTVQIARITYDLPSLDDLRAEKPLPPFDLGTQLAATLKPGGCAAVICTTVGRAQRTYLALKQSFASLPDDERPEVFLFHARHRFGERNAWEQLTLARFGKVPSTVLEIDGKDREIVRPARAVLVATQVIEQSLDLDFDLMVSELAPIDLLLQRLGRLHRHERPERPAHLGTPTLWLAADPVEDGAPHFEPDQRAVYDEHVLLRSWLKLRDLPAVRIPENVEPFIKAVYDDATCPPEESAAVQNRWTKSEEALARVRGEQERKAEHAILMPPNDPANILEAFNPKLSEDDPTAHDTLRALTRLGDPSLPMVLLAPDEEALADLGPDRPEIDRVRKLLERSATLTHRGLVPQLLRESGQQEAKAHPSWRRSALLRHHRLLILDANGAAQVLGYTVTVDPELGIVVRPPDRQRG